MSYELQALTVYVLVFFLTIGAQAAPILLVNGLNWALGARDEVKPDTVYLGRAKRTIANSLEAMAIFAPLALIADAAGLSTSLTHLGAALFVGARIGYVFAYLAGVPVVRTLLWTASVVGAGMIGFEIYRFGF